MPIKLRLTLLFAFGAAALLTVLAALFVGRLRAGLLGNLDGTLRVRAAEVIGQLGDGTNFQDPGPNALLLPGGSYGQVLTVGGAVVESSDGLGGQRLLTAAQAAAAATIQISVDGTVTLAAALGNGEAHTVRVLAMSAGRPGVVVAVAASREVIDEAVTTTARQLLLLGIPALLLAGAGARALSGAALRPVEHLRRQAADLQANDADVGLAVPATRDEIARLAVTFNGLLNRLHAALERERAFVADAGHELRTPLTVLKGELELASRPGRSREELTETIRTVSVETDRLVRLTEDLLDVSRNNTARSRMKELDVAAVAQSAAVAARNPATNSRGVQISVAQSETRVATGDPDRIRQAIDNLLTNAVRSSPPEGTVTVAAYADGPDILIEVVDEGPGFPVGFVPKAFERFTRADEARARTTAEGGGSGLGLAIVKSIMTEHDGTAVARNNDPRPGATVTLRWPGNIADRNG